MSYCKLYFGKELEEITFQDVIDFFKKEKEESDKIEFKSYTEEEGKNLKEKCNGILRTIAGMLNSEGGLIIWGAPVGRLNDATSKKKFFIGDLTATSELVEKDSFINRITDSITPSPHGNKFKPIEKAGKYVYLIEVEKSNYSPHQFRNGYFMRLDGQTVYAPHHYIEALFRKISFPRLEGYITITNVLRQPTFQRISLSITIHIFNKSKLQNEYDLYCRLLIGEGKFKAAEYNNGQKLKYPSGMELVYSPAKDILFYGEYFYHPEQIEISLTEDTQFEFYVGLFFGGKSSPMMLSEYKVNVGSIPMGTSDYTSMLTSINENQYLHEKTDSKQLSEKERIKRIIGR